MVPQRTAQIKQFIYWPLAIPSVLVYLFMIGNNKKKLKMDVARFWTHLKGHAPKSYLYSFYYLVCGIREFRNVFYMRVGYLSLLFQYFLPPIVELNFATKSRFIGGGVLVQHGYTAVVDAASIGENLWINQNITIGHGGKGHPTIGNNVRIGSGALLIGDIKIGDNVNIGGNAIVVEDVPSNVTICSPKAIIVKHNNGETANAMLADRAYQNIL